MAKKRVHEIAKERGISSKEVLAVLQAAGLDVKAAASSVDESEIERAFAAKNGGGEAKAEPAPAKPPGRRKGRRKARARGQEAAGPRPAPRPLGRRRRRWRGRPPSPGRDRLPGFAPPAGAAAPAAATAPPWPPPAYSVGRARPERSRSGARRGAADSGELRRHGR